MKAVVPAKAGYTSAISPRDAREFFSTSRPLKPKGAVLPQEGSRECRALDAPAASRGKKTRELVTTVTPGRPAFPAQWF
jgi:hypothetical protein